VAIARLLAALAVTLGALGGTAQAAVTGSVVDPAGDMSLDNGDSLPDPTVDFTNVLVTYDAATGRVDVAFTFSEAPPTDYGIRAGIGIGTIDADNHCTAPVFTSGSFHEDGALTQGAAIVGQYNLSRTYSGSGVEGRLWDADDPAGEHSWFDSDDPIFDWQGGPKSEWNLGTINKQLLGRNYNCAYAVMLAQGSDGEGLDFSSEFPLGAAPAAQRDQPPATPAPSTVDQNDVLSIVARRLGLGAARHAARRVLSNRYGKRFTKGKRYRITCRGDLSKT